MIKSQNPYKEYPSNLGKKWSDEEETTLLDALSKNISIKEKIKKTKLYEKRI